MDTVFSMLAGGKIQHSSPKKHREITFSFLGKRKKGNWPSTRNFGWYVASWPWLEARCTQILEKSLSSMQVYQLLKHLFSWWEWEPPPLWLPVSFCLNYSQGKEWFSWREVSAWLFSVQKLALCFIVGKHFHNVCSAHLTFSQQCCFLCTIYTTNNAVHWVGRWDTCRNTPFWGKRTNSSCVVWFQAHLVAAFEQSLGNMTIRLQSLTMTAEQKVTSRRIWEVFSLSSIVARAPSVVVWGKKSHTQFALALSFVVIE